MAVSLNHKGFSDLHATNLCDASDVVSGQINQHDMLGSLFGVGEQLFFCLQVFLHRGPPGPSPSQGANGDLLSLRDGLLSDQNFRRRADHVEVSHVVVKHVGAGVQSAQSPVQGQGALGVGLA